MEVKVGQRVRLEGAHWPDNWANGKEGIVQKVAHFTCSILFDSGEYDWFLQDRVIPIEEKKMTHRFAVDDIVCITSFTEGLTKTANESIFGQLGTVIEIEEGPNFLEDEVMYRVQVGARKAWFYSHMLRAASELAKKNFLGR